MYSNSITLCNTIVYTSHAMSLLYSGQDLSGSTIGIAFIGRICRRTGAGVVQDASNSLDYVGGIVAHELGHLFSMGHDNRREYID